MISFYFKYNILFNVVDNHQFQLILDKLEIDTDQERQRMKDNNTIVNIF